MPKLCSKISKFDQLQPVLSVNLIAYNQEQTIRRALESIFEQKINFSMEVLLADDASTDSTFTVIEEYQKKYPSTVRAIRQEHNVGPTRNAYTILSHSRGRYIASLEGDDYYCNVHFLQSAVDFLEANEKYIGIQDRCIIVDENGRNQVERQQVNGNEFWQYTEQEYGLKEFQEWLMPGHISALVYRNVFKLYPEEDYNILYKLDPFVGDRTILMQLVVRGRIYCSKRVSLSYQLVEKTGAQNWMSQYRKANKRMDEYRMICSLENYLREHYHLAVDMDQLKRNKVVAAAAIFAINPSWLNVKVLWGIIRYQGCSLSKLWLAFSAIVQKKYFCWRGEPKRRIRIR